MLAPLPRRDPHSLANASVIPTARPVSHDAFAFTTSLAHASRHTRHAHDPVTPFIVPCLHIDISLSVGQQIHSPHHPARSFMLSQFHPCTLCFFFATTVSRCSIVCLLICTHTSTASFELVGQADLFFVASRICALYGSNVLRCSSVLLIDTRRISSGYITAFEVSLRDTEVIVTSQAADACYQCVRSNSTSTA